MNRTKSILAAGGLTGLVLLTLLALGWADRGAQAAEAPALPETGGLTNDQALQAWQEYAANLEATVRTMQDREGAYQAELEAANAAINELNAQASSSPVLTGAALSGDDDHYESRDHDDDGYENEHEGYEDD